MGLTKIADVAEWEKVKAAEGKPVFVQFSAEWCGPCQSIEGNLDEFAEKYKDKMDFKYFDVEQDDFDEIAQAEEVANMPTFKIYK